MNNGNKVWVHLAAIRVNGQEISQVCLAAIGCKRLMQISCLFIIRNVDC